MKISPREIVERKRVCQDMISIFWMRSCAGIVTRRPLVLQLHKTEEGQEYGEFLHTPKKRFYDFGMFTPSWKQLCISMLQAGRLVKKKPAYTNWKRSIRSMSR